ncbi:MAG: hypothetical protein ACPG6B_08405 [Oceanihabitans sp.]
MKNLVLLISLIILTNSFAQEKEYLVTLKNDTVFGKIYRSTNFTNPSKITFKIKDENGNKSLINPSEIKVIKSLKGVDGDCFIVPYNNQFYLKKIISGRINVYQLINAAILYVSKENSEIFATDIGLFSRKKSKQQIRLLLADNLEIVKELDVLKGSSKNILKLINKYNAMY